LDFKSSALSIMLLAVDKKSFPVVRVVFFALVAVELNDDINESRLDLKLN